MDNVVYYMLQSCGVQARNYLSTGKINLTYLASKKLFRIANIFDVPISQRMDYFSMIWMHRLASLGIQTSRRYQLWFRWSCTGKKLSQKYGVHQVVTNCCSCNIFPKFQKNLGPSFCLNQFDFLLWFDLMIFSEWFSNAWIDPSLVWFFL